MNPVADFFRRYSAVPATDSGPTWSQASGEVLLEWFNKYAPIVRCAWNKEQARVATAKERHACMWIYNEIVAELKKRCDAAEPNPDPYLYAALLRSKDPVTR